VESGRRDKLLELYTDLGMYDWLYIRLRAKLLPLELYQEMLPSEGLLVDVGCSYGIVANYLSLSFPNSQVIGIDLGRKRIKIASKTIKGRQNIHFVLRDVRDWVLPPCAGVIMIDFLHHISRRWQELILRKVFHSLGKGGVLLVSEVDPEAKPF
jgi:2-polyprenyl-3-methyl-5-hydroxy-6-metoxy-1,4-benzoquinol methylase